MTDVDRILAPGGPVASSLGAAFEPRPEQLDMARAVAETMDASSHLLVEAGTGVGKSFAYLVPAILRCIRDKQTVVVATHTIALQEQLIQKDLPRLTAALEAEPGIEDLRAVLVKGRGNYISIRRTELAIARADVLFPDAAQRLALSQLKAWADRREYGPLSVPPHEPFAMVRDQVESDADNCMGRKCPRYKECFYQTARRQIEGANLLICNHALFFSDLALRIAGKSGVLPRYHHVVLDEAHTLEDVAADHLGVSLAEGRVLHLLRTLFEPRRSKGYLAQLRQNRSLDQNAVDRAIERTADAGHAARDFFDGWLHLLESGALPGGRIREPGMVDNVITPAFADLALRLSALRDAVPEDQDKAELNAYIARADSIAQAAEYLVEQKLEDTVYWVEQRRTAARRPRVELVCAPVEVGPVLKEHLFSREHSVVLTSATLATGVKAPSRRRRAPAPPEDWESQVAPEEAAVRTTDPAAPPDMAGFSHIASRLGCIGARTLLLGSPFDYASQVELHIERDMPDPRAGRPRPQEPDANGLSAARIRAALTERDAAPTGPDSPVRAGSPADRLAARILHHIDATDGGALVLFTSFSMLRTIAERLRAPLADRNMTLLEHAEGAGAARTALLARLREGERCVLFGAASFWQGVDVPGRALRNVIIVQLPFDPPDRPLTEARLDVIRQRGGDPFHEDSLPRAVIRFKQGFGRLIRSRTDTGRVVVLDPRIVTKGYGRRFLDALPKGVKIINR